MDEFAIIDWRKHPVWFDLRRNICAQSAANSPIDGSHCRVLELSDWLVSYRARPSRGTLGIRQQRVKLLLGKVDTTHSAGSTAPLCGMACQSGRQPFTWVA
jgi:hypothetical protein